MDYLKNKKDRKFRKPPCHFDLSSHSGFIISKIRKIGECYEIAKK